MEVRKSNGLEILYYAGFAQGERVVHGFSTRGGGVSMPPFSSLNLAFHVGDEPEAVINNRRRLFEALGLDLTASAWANQVHGDRIAVVGRDLAGSGALDVRTALPGIDALVTNVPGVSVAVMTADCLPILIFDPVNTCIGAVHAGWRGTVQKLAAKTIQRMQEEYGSKPEQCQVALGPSIEVCCFEVGADTIQAFSRSLPEIYEQIMVARAGSYYIDLNLANSLILQGIGVSGQNIYGNSSCTACNVSQLFSYRREGGRTGRLVGVIGLVE